MLIHVPMPTVICANGGVQLRERIGFKRAAVAVARKLAVIMHAMLESGQPFNRAVGATI